GYVGLPLAIEFARQGIRVCGIEKDPDKVAKLNRGQNYILDVDNDELARFVSEELLSATTDYSAVSRMDAISICVPTPLNKTGDPDISYIIHARDEMIRHLKKGTVIVLESTTYPGTTEEVIAPAFEEAGFKVGEDIFIAFSPERIDPGNRFYGTRNTPKVIGGITPKCLEMASAVYRLIIDELVPVSSTRSAECAKLLENTFRSINIGLVNELAIMCHILDVDVWEVIRAAATKPFGFMPFYPGPGLGGHCIPIDPIYLSWKLKTLNYRARFIELASEINTHMPEYVVDRVTLALNEHERSVKGAKILLLGVSYKRDIDDSRESPALDILELLTKRGAQVQYHDPYISKILVSERTLESVELTGELLGSQDVVVITTDHRVLDYEWICSSARLVFDTRNATEKLGHRKNIVRL
ncbi:MAG: nucleotide sugar dehydrogenase, partial [Calditrichaeota bacterium]|nr:nucleotide sugar dehydrogenase [Calditrichota bacterium]